MVMQPVHIRLCFGVVLWIVYMNFAAASLAPVQPPNYKGPAHSAKRAPVSPLVSPGSSGAPVQPPNYKGPTHSDKRAPVSPPLSPGSSGAPAQPPKKAPVSPPPQSPPRLPRSPPSLPPPPVNMNRTGPSKGLNGGEKAGIVIGTLTGAGLLACFGVVYKKRRSNNRRAQLGYEAERHIL